MSEETAPLFPADTSAFHPPDANNQGKNSEIGKKDLPLRWNNKKQNIMYKIQANASGTRSINVSDEHLATIRKYSLLKNLIDSTGFIDEQVLDKLKLNMRSMLESNMGADKGLVDLCLDVVYNKNMKAFGLHQLVLLYIEWDEKNYEGTEPED